MQTVSNPSSTLKNAHPTDKGAAEQQRLLSINDDELFSDLFQKGYIDKTGLCLNTMPPIPEIGIAVEKKVLQLFKCPLKKEFKITHGELVTIEFTLQELFQYLLCTQNNVKIEEIEIFGSTVPWLLQEGDFLDRAFQSLKTSKQSVDSFTNLPSDLDLRVRIPSADVAVITAFRKNTVTFFCDKIGSFLGKSGRSLNTNDRNVVIQWGFSKYTTPKEQRISSVIGLGGLCSDAFFKDFDILFEKGNGRKCMMSLDALRIPVMRLVRGEPRQPIYPVAEFSTGPWQPIIDRLRRVVRAENLETLDPIAIKRAFSDSLLGYVSVTKDLESTLLHKIVKAIENEEPHLLQQLSNEVKNAEFRDKIAFVLSDWLKGAAGSHFNHNRHARVLIALRNFTAITKAQLPEAAYLIQEIWKGMAFAQPQEASLLETHALAPLDTGLHPLLLAMKTCLNKNLSLLDPILALLEVKTFLLACNYSSIIGPRLSLSCLHGCLDLKIDGLHYFLPLDPVDALTRLFKSITPENESLFLSIDRALPRLASFDRHQTPLIKKTLNESQLKAIKESLTKYLNDAIQKEIHPLCLRICLEAFFAINNLGMEGISFNRAEAFIPKMTAQLETDEEKQLFLDDIRTCKLKPQEISALEFMQKTLKSQPTSTALSWAQALLQTGDEARISAALQLCKAEIKPESCWSEPLSDILERVSLYRLDLFAKLLLEWAQGNVQPEIILRSLSFAEKPLSDNRIKIDKAKVLLHLVQTLNVLAAKRQADAEFIIAFNCIISAAFSHNVSTEEILKTCSHVDSNWSEYGEQKAAWVAQLLERSQWQQAYKLWEKLFSSAEEPGALDSLEQLLTALTSQPSKSQSIELIKLSLTACKHVFFNQLFHERKTAALQLLEKSINLAMGWKKDNLIPDLMQMMKSCSNNQILGYISFYLTSKGDSLKPDIQEWILTNWQLLTDSLVVESPSLCLAFISNCSTTHKLKWVSADSLAILNTLLASSLTPKEKIRANTLFSEVRTQLKGKVHPKVESIIQSLLKEKLYTEAKEWLDIYESSDRFVHAFQKAIQEAEESKMEQVFDFVKELTLTNEAISQLIAEAFCIKFNLSSHQSKQLTLSLRVPYPEKKLPVRIAWIKALTLSGLQEKCESAYRLSCGLIQEQKPRAEADPLLKELLLEQLTAFQTTFPNLAAKLLIEAYPKYIDFATTAKIMIQLTEEGERLPLFKTFTLQFLELKEVKAPDGFAALLHTLISSENKHQLLFKLQSLANSRILSESDWKLCQGYYANWIERFNLNTELTEAGTLWSLWNKEMSPPDSHAHLSNSLNYLLKGLSHQLEKLSTREILPQYLLIIQSDQGIKWLKENDKEIKTLHLLIERSLHSKKPMVDEVLCLLRKLFTTNETFSIGMKLLFKTAELIKPPHPSIKVWLEQNFNILTNTQYIATENAYKLMNILNAFQCTFPQDIELTEILNMLYVQASSQSNEDLRTGHGQIDCVRKMIQKSELTPNAEAILTAFFTLHMQHGYYKEAKEWALLLKLPEQRALMIKKIIDQISVDEKAEELVDPVMLDTKEMQQIFAKFYIGLIFDSSFSIAKRFNRLIFLQKNSIYEECIHKELLIDPENSINDLIILWGLDGDTKTKIYLFKLACSLFPAVSSDRVISWLDRIFPLLELKEGKKCVNESFRTTFSKAFGAMVRCMENREVSETLLCSLLKANHELQLDSSLTHEEANFYCRLIIQKLLENYSLLSSIHPFFKSPYFFQTIQNASPELKWRLYFFIVDRFLEMGCKNEARICLPRLFEIHHMSNGSVWKENNKMIQVMQTWVVLWKDDEEKSGSFLMKELALPESEDAVHFKSIFYSNKDPFERINTLSQNFTTFSAYIPLKDIHECLLLALKNLQEKNTTHFYETIEACLFTIIKLEKAPMESWHLLIQCCKNINDPDKRGILVLLWENFWLSRSKYMESPQEKDLYLLCCSLLFTILAKQETFYITLRKEHQEEIYQLLANNPLANAIEATKTFLCYFNMYQQIQSIKNEYSENLLNNLISNAKIKKDFQTWIVTSTYFEKDQELQGAWLEYTKMLYESFPKQNYKNMHLNKICCDIATTISLVNSNKAFKYLLINSINFLEDFITRFENGEGSLYGFLIEILKLNRLSVDHHLEIILHLSESKYQAQIASRAFFIKILETVLQSNHLACSIQDDEEGYFNKKIRNLPFFHVPICNFSCLNQIPYFEHCMKLYRHIDSQISKDAVYMNPVINPDKMILILKIGYRNRPRTEQDNQYMYLFSLYLELSRMKMNTIREMKTENPNPTIQKIIVNEIAAIVNHIAMIIEIWFNFMKKNESYRISKKDPLLDLMDELIYFPTNDLLAFPYTKLDFSSPWLDEKRRYQYGIYLKSPPYYLELKNPEIRIEAVRELVIRLLKDKSKKYVKKCALMITADLFPLGEHFEEITSPSYPAAIEIANLTVTLWIDFFKIIRDDYLKFPTEMTSTDGEFCKLVLDSLSKKHNQQFLQTCREDLSYGLAGVLSDYRYVYDKALQKREERE